MMAFITSGITANCLLMVVIGIQMLRYRTDPGNLGATIWNKQARPRLLRENSHMLRDNTILSLALLTPFLVLAMVLYELAASPSSAAHDSGASR